MCYIPLSSFTAITVHFVYYIFTKDHQRYSCRIYVKTTVTKRMAKYVNEGNIKFDVSFFIGWLDEENVFRKYLSQTEKIISLCYNCFTKPSMTWHVMLVWFIFRRQEEIWKTAMDAPTPLKIIYSFKKYI